MGLADPPTPRRPRRMARADARLDRADWISAARTALIEGGIDRVKVLPLAQSLGVTTGSFYWHFPDRAALLAALLADWEQTSSQGFVDAVAGSADPHAQFEHVVDVWLAEDRFSPAYDSAVRDWARVSPEVEAVVRRVDEGRIELLRGIFRAMGDPAPDDLVRARIVYYHQTGYYAMRINLSAAERKRLLPVYLRLLKGVHHR